MRDIKASSADERGEARLQGKEPTPHVCASRRSGPAGEAVRSLVRALPLFRSYVTVAIIWCKTEARGGTTVQRVRVHVGVIGFVGLSLTLGPGLHDPGSAAPRAETAANEDDYFPDAIGSRGRYGTQVVDLPPKTMG